MTRLTQFAVREKSVVLLLAVGLFLSGLFAWGQLRQELLPDIELPIVTVIAALPGAGAEDVAAQLTEPMEQALANVPRLQSIQSTSANSLSLVVAQFSYGTDLKETLSTIGTQLDTATLPEGVDPRVTALNINDQPVVIATIGPALGADPAEAAAFARSVVLPEVRGLEGVSSADLSGGPTTVLRITLDPARMAEAGIPLSQVQGVIQANQITLPAGTITEGSVRLPISAEHRFASVDELKGLIVGVKGMPPTGGTGTSGAPTGGTGTSGAPTGGAGTTPSAAPTPILLGQIATVELEQVQLSGYARTNGVPSLTLTVSKASGANTVEVADAVTAAFHQIEQDHPDLVQITVIQDLSTFIKESRDGLVREGLLGAFFAVLTIFVFLLSLRSTLVAAVSIPLSILIALTIMGVAGLTINIITLGALAVAVGRVVDDSIVVLENIYRHRAKGEEIGDAVLNGTREVAAAITSSTVTTVAVFLPIGFVGGIVSQFFLPFGLTVTFALLASLFVALTVIPVLAYFFVRKVNVKVDENGELPETIWQRLYTPMLSLALRRRATKLATLGIALLLFVVTTALVPLLPTAFINSGGQKILEVTVAPPTGASSDVVLDRVSDVEQILMGDDQVTLVQSTIPGDADTGVQTLQSAFSGRASNSATITVVLADDADLDAKTEELTTALAPASTDGFTVAVEQQSGFGGGGFSVIVSGDDPAAVKAASDVLVPALAGVDGLANVESDLAAAAPQVAVNVIPNKAITVGLTTAQVAGQLRDVLVGQSIGTVALEDGTTAQALMRVDASDLTSVEALKQLPVGSPTNQVPLSQIADVAQVDAQGSVTRVDGAPAATIKATVTSDDQGGVSKAAQQVVDDLSAAGQIPPGVDVRLAGVTQQQNEAFGSLFAAMGVAILVVYIVMVLVFGSLVDPLVIMFSLPLATIGAFPALLITGRPIGISALIGFLMLIGIVVTNAIVLLDLVEQLRHRGLSTHDALMQGGRTRVRPILMTAVATILALLPVAAGLSQGSIIAAELGTVVIGGLFSSTFLTLLVIPVIYSLVDGAKLAVSRRFGGSHPETIAPQAPSSPTPTA